MFSGRYRGLIERKSTVNTMLQDGVRRPLTALGSQCCLQQRPCSAGDYRSLRRLQRGVSTDGAGGRYTPIQKERDRAVGQLRPMIRAAPASGQGHGLRSGHHQADPGDDSQGGSRCLTPCSDNCSRKERLAEESTNHSRASSSATLHLYLPSTFYDKEGANEKDLEAGHSAGLPQQQETIDAKTDLSPPSQKGPKHGKAKQGKSAAAKRMPKLGQESMLYPRTQNTARPSRDLAPATISLDPTGGNPPLASTQTPQHPLQEEDRGARVEKPPCCPVPKRLVWQPSKVKDNYYERAVLTKATDNFKLKTTTTLEWGLQGPQTRKNVFILQAQSRKPTASLCGDANSVYRLGRYSRPSSTQSCVRTDFSLLQGPGDTTHSDLSYTST